MADIIEFSSRRTRITADERSPEEQTYYLMKIIRDLDDQVRRTSNAVLAYQTATKAMETDT